jgi:hypothetical protein
MLKPLYLLICISLFSTASAHQPRIVYQQQIPQTNPILIKNPEISQAFYAELKGQPEYYKIISEQEINLYVQILSPKITDAKKDFSVEVINDTNVIELLNGPDSIWTEFYEPFVGDSYWRGAQFSQQVPEGEYLIKVYNQDNIGKYVLVVGQAESFPLNETIKLFVSLPQLKQYFGKSGYTAFFNLVGLFFLIQIVIFVVVIFGLVWIVKKVRKRFSRLTIKP